MAVKIRLARIGKRGKATYRIVVVPTRSKRTGGALDFLGFYHENSAALNLDQAKYEKWLKFGAQTSDGLRKVLRGKGKK